MAYSPDGRKIATVSTTLSILIWEVDAEDEPQEIEVLQHEDLVHCLAWMADCRHLVSGGGDCKVRMWDSLEGLAVRDFEGHSNWVMAVACTRVGSAIASGSCDCSVRLWDGATGQLERVLEAHTDWVASVAFSPDDALLVSGSRDRSIRLWDLKGGPVVRSSVGHLDDKPHPPPGHGHIPHFNGHNDRVRAVAFAPDQRSVASASRDGCVAVWGLRLQPLFAIQAHMGYATMVSYSPDSCFLATGGKDSVVRVWDASDGTLLKELRGHPRGLAAVAHSPLGTRIASAARDGSLYLWDATCGIQLRKVPSSPLAHKNRNTAHISYGAISPRQDVYAAATPAAPPGLGGGNAQSPGLCRLDFQANHRPLLKAINVVAFSPEGGAIFAGCRDHTIRLWDVAQGGLVRVLERHTDWVTALAWTCDGELVSGGRDCVIFLWRWNASTMAVDLLRRVDQQPYAVTCLTCSPKKPLLVSGSHTAELLVWHTRRAAAVGRLQGAMGPATCVGFAPHAERVASASQDKHVRVWQCFENVPLTRRPIMECESPCVVTCLAFSRDGRHIYCGGDDQHLYALDEQGHQLWAHKGQCGPITAVATLPGNPCVIMSGRQPDLCLWAADGTLTDRLTGHHRPVFSIAAARDGQFIASAGAGCTVQVFAMPGGRKHRVLHDMRTAVAYASDGQYGAGPDDLGGTAVWHLPTGNAVAVLPWFHVVAFSPDGLFLLGVTADHGVHIWSMRDMQKERQLAMYPHLVTCVACPPGCSYVAAGSIDHSVLLWDGPGDAPPVVLGQHSGIVVSVCCSQDGSLIATASYDRSIGVWRREEGEFCRVPLEARHREPSLAVAFCPASDVLLSGGADHCLRIWRVQEDSVQTTARVAFPAQQGVISAITFCEALPAAEIRGQGTVGAAGAVTSYAVPPNAPRLLAAAQTPAGAPFLVEEATWFGAMGLLCLDLRANEALLHLLLEMGEPEWRLAAATMYLPAAMATARSEMVLHYATLVATAVSQTNAKIHAACHGAGGGPPCHLHLGWLARFDLVPVLTQMAQTFPEALQALLSHSSLLDVPTRCVDRAHFANGTFIVSGSPSACCQGDECPGCRPGPAPDAAAWMADHCLVPFRGLAKVHCGRRGEAGGAEADCGGWLCLLAPQCRRVRSSFLQALVETNDPELFQSLAIRALVVQKWRMFARRSFLCELAMYLLGLLSLCLITLNLPAHTAPVEAWAHLPRGTLTTAPALVLLGTSVFLIWFELIQLLAHGRKNYFENGWNFLQLSGFLLCTACATVRLFRWELSPLLLAGTVYLQWLGLLYYLQPFEATGVQIRTLIGMLYDVRWFLAVSAIIMLGGAHTFLVLLQDSDVSDNPAYASPWDALFTVFATFLLMNLDQAPFMVSPYRRLLQVLVMVCTVLISIVLVNLLVALMNSSFGRISERCTMEQTLLQARIVVEMELLIPDADLQRTDWFPEFLHVLVPRGDNRPVQALPEAARATGLRRVPSLPAVAQAEELPAALSRTRGSAA